MGYVRAENPYRLLNKANFSTYKKSKSYLERNNIPCLNEAMVDENKNKKTGYPRWMSWK